MSSIDNLISGYERIISSTCNGDEFTKDVHHHFERSVVSLDDMESIHKTIEYLIKHKEELQQQGE